MKARTVKLFSLYFFALSVLLAQGCSEPSPAVVVLEGETMGTYYQVKLVLPEEDREQLVVRREELRDITEQALGEVNQRMSTYIADSELMQFNRSPVGSWVDISAPLYEVLQISASVSRLSAGAFDITIAPLVNLWGFGPDRSSERPAQPDIEKALTQLGYRHLELRDDPPRARRTADIELDLSAVAKGYGADFLAEQYQAQGYGDFMVEIGGELRLAGRNARGQPWRIGVETPSLDRTGVAQAVELSDAGMATSGDYRNYYEVDGQRFSHTIDPTTGYPIGHNLVSVTVIADSAAEADALATAFNVLGGDRSRELAESENIAAYFIERENDQFVLSHSKAFIDYLP